MRENCLCSLQKGYISVLYPNITRVFNKNSVYFRLQQTQTKTVIRTIPSSMLSTVKAGQAGIQTAPGGAKTIVIAAPKGASGAGQTPTKILSSMPKLAGQGNTQFIVVSPQGSTVVTPGGSTVAQAIGKILFILWPPFKQCLIVKVLCTA